MIRQIRQDVVDASFAERMQNDFFLRTTKRPAPPCTLPTRVSVFLLKFDIIAYRLPKTNLYHEVCAQINYHLLSHSFGTTAIPLATCTLQDSDPHFMFTVFCTGISPTNADFGPEEAADKLA